MEKFFYRVNGGDGLLSIASKFNVPPILIIKDNNLKDEIQAGDVLFISKTGGRTYTAKPFDTMESVAAQFNVSAERLKETNGADYLFYGLTVVIPE